MIKNLRACNLYLYIILVTAFLASCKKFEDPALFFEEEPELVAQKARKVLIISIDGLSGLELKKDVPENIGKLLAHAKYTYEGMADANTGDASTWATLLSGISSNNHGIHGNSFEEELDEDDPHGDNSSGESIGFITFFQRVLEQGKNFKSFSATSVQILDENIMSYADFRILKNNDVEVKDAAINTLESENISFGVVNFRGVNDAGLTGGFNLDNPAYKKAIDQVDDYIGEIKTALESREEFEKEDWMIVVTANHGGRGNAYGGGSLEERKVPIIFYNTNFVGQEYEIPDFTNSFKARNGINGTIPAADADRYNIGTSGEFTIQLKLLMHQFGTLNGAIISKQNNTGNPDDGWSFIHNGGLGWRLKVKGTHVVAGTPTFEVGKWYTLTARIYMDGATRKAQVFTDGALISDGTVGTVQGTSTANFNVGYSASYVGGTLIQSVKDVVIYDTALPVEYIQNNYCKSPVDNTYASNMIGNWSMSDGTGNKLKNDVVGAPDFTLNGTYAWEFMQSDFCKMLTGTVENENEMMVSSTDVLPQIAYWLGITPHDSWGLEGKLFLNQYEMEFLAN